MVNPGIILLFTILIKLSGIGRTLMMSYILGTSNQTDLYFSLFKVFNLIKRALGEGVVYLLIIPTMRKLNKEEISGFIKYILLLFFFIGLLFSFGIYKYISLLNVTSTGFNIPFISKIIVSCNFIFFLISVLINVIEVSPNGIVSYISHIIPNIIPMIFLCFTSFNFNKFHIISIGILLGYIFQFIILLIPFLKYINIKSKLFIPKNSFVTFCIVFIYQISYYIPEFITSYNVENNLGLISSIEYSEQMYQGIFNTLSSIFLVNILLPLLRKKNHNFIQGCNDILRLLLSIGFNLSLFSMLWLKTICLKYNLGNILNIRQFNLVTCNTFLVLCIALLCKIFTFIMIEHNLNKEILISIMFSVSITVGAFNMIPVSPLWKFIITNNLFILIYCFLSYRCLSKKKLFFLDRHWKQLNNIQYYNFIIEGFVQVILRLTIVPIIKIIFIESVAFPVAVLLNMYIVSYNLSFTQSKPIKRIHIFLAKNTSLVRT